MVMDWASAKQAMTSGPAYTYNVGAGHSSFDSDDDDDSGHHPPITTVDEIINQPISGTVSIGGGEGQIDAGLAAAAGLTEGETWTSTSGWEPDPSLGSGTAGNGTTGTPTITGLIDETAGNYPLITGDNLTDEQKRWNLNIALQNLWQSGGAGLHEGHILGVSSPFGGTFQDEINTNPYNLIYHTGGVDENTPGAVLLNQNDIIKAKQMGWKAPEPQWGQPIMSGLGEELLNYDWSNVEGGMPTPEQIGEMGADSPILADFQDITKDYYRRREEESWDPWADTWYEGHYQGGGYDDSMSDLARYYWFSESLDDVTARKEERRKAGLGAAGMRASEMEQMYGREFAAEANPHHDPGYSQAVTSELDPIYGSRLLWETARME